MEAQNIKNNGRTNKITICLTDDEKIKVEAYAETERMQVSPMLRKMVLDKAYNFTESH